MRIEGVLFWVFPHRGECEFREKNILGEELYHFCDSEDCLEFVPWT